MEQTAVKSLIKDLVKNQMISLNNSQINYSELENIIDKHLRIEKNQMQKICFRTLETCDDPRAGSLFSYFDELYNETFKSE
jgi:hypothetical protein